MSAAPITGSTASLRPSGIGRYILGTILLMWLGGWAVGELFVLAFLVMLVRSVVGTAIGASWPIPGGDWIAGGAAGLFFLFGLIWLLLWTVGGIAAITELLRSLAGEDRISVEMGGVAFERRAGPFGRTRTVDRSGIRRVRVRDHDKAVVIDTAAGSEVITKFGTVDERRAVAEWLRARLSLSESGAAVDPTATPPGWNMTVAAGTTHLTRTDLQAQRTGALIMWGIVAFMGLIWYGSSARLSTGSVVAAALTLLVAVAAAWVTWSRREWRVRHGELSAHTAFLMWQRERSFRSARLEVAISTDSDNDDHYTLNVIDADGKRKIASEMNDEAETVDLARWLAARTGFPLTLPRQLQ